jgi:hypothetical protein
MNMNTTHLTLLLGLFVGACACNDEHIVGDKVSTATGGASITQGGGSSSNERNSTGGSATRSSLTTPPSGGTSGNDGQGTTVTNILSGGSSGAITALDETCTLPATQFEFTVDDATAFCTTGGTDTVQVEIFGLDGSKVSFLTNYEPAVSPLRKRCPECGAKGYYSDMPTQGAARGFTGIWNGDREEIVLCDSSTSPGRNQYQCGIRRCVAPGRYTARYCLAAKEPNQACEDAGFDSKNWLPRNVCIDVPFDFPSTNVVRGVVTKALIPAGGGGQGGSSSIGGATSG